MNIHEYLLMVYNQEKQIKEAFIKVAEYHKAEPDIYYNCLTLASYSMIHIKKTGSLADKYLKYLRHDDEPDQMAPALMKEFEPGGTLLNDLQYLWLLTKELEIGCNILLQASMTLHDKEIVSLCGNLEKENMRQADWLISRIRQAASQVLSVSE
jgi:hypothetical protein